MRPTVNSERCDLGSASPQEQARHWERKLDLLLRLEAEALVERLGIGGAEPHQRRAPYGWVIEQ
jgi:hypothetical protein